MNSSASSRVLPVLRADQPVECKRVFDGPTCRHAPVLLECSRVTVAHTAVEDSGVPPLIVRREYA